MKRPIHLFMIACLVLCMLAVLSACDRNPGPVTTSSCVPVSTEPPRPLPQPGPDRLEIEGEEAGPVYVLDGVSYVDIRDITGPLSLTESEPENGLLKLSRESETGELYVLLRDGSEESEDREGRMLQLGAPVLRGNGTWYLPLSGVELFVEKNIYFPDEHLVRSMNTTAGPVIRFNGKETIQSMRLGNAPIFFGELLSRLTGAQLVHDSDPDGTPTLTVSLDEQVLTLRSDSMEAEWNGEALTLSFPAFSVNTGWFVPVEAVKLLGFVEAIDENENQIDLWQISDGPEIWFDGTKLAVTRLCGDTPCAPLSELTAALGGRLKTNGKELVLTAGGRELKLWVGSVQALGDKESLTLPSPVLPDGEEVLVPAETAAAFFGLAKQEGEKLIWSRMEPRETVIWVDGKEADSFTHGEDETLYLRLNDALLLSSNEPESGENRLSFTAFGKEIVLTGGSSEASVDGERVSLASPVRADGEIWYAPANELLTALGLSELEDPELDQIYYTHIVRNDSLAEGYRVPVLMYHAVSDNIWGIPELFISPSTLETQIQALLEGGYTAITFEDLDRIDEIEKPVMLTFDDGYDDNYTELFPLLKQYNVKATVFIIVNDLGKNHKLTRDQVREMSDSGLVSIQSHTMSHGYLDGMSEKQLHREHYDSMLALARITGKQPFVMCYPTGKNAGYTRKITAEYYEYGLCMGGPCWVTGDAPYRIYRYYIPRKTSLDTFLSYLAG